MALTFTWAGTTGAWTTPSSWVGGALPGAVVGDVILFDGSNTYTSTVNENLNSNPDQLIITDPNANLVSADGELLNVTAFSTSGLQMSAGTITIAVLTGSAFAFNTGTISGGLVNIGSNGEFDIENNGTLTLTSTGSISLTAGEIDIGHERFGLYQRR
jgi:hypothetical protein